MNNKNKREELAIFIQVILAFSTFFIAIMSIFVPSFLVVTEGMIAILLFDMAYNNHLLYHTKWVTPIYIIVGCVMMGLFIVMVMNLGESFILY